MLRHHAVVVAVAVGGDDCKVVVCVVGSGFGSSDVPCLCQDFQLSFAADCNRCCMCYGVMLW